MRIEPLEATYPCTIEEAEELVSVHRLHCCEPAGVPFIALRFSGENEALLFKLAINAAVVEDDTAFISPDAWPEAEEALNQMELEADRFDLLPIWVWDTRDKAVFDAAFGHRVYSTESRGVHVPLVYGSALCDPLTS